MHDIRQTVVTAMIQSSCIRPLRALVVEPGLRFDRHDYTGDSAWSPRLNAALTLGRATVRAAWGDYRQSQGLHEISVADGERTFQRGERAEHRVLGGGGKNGSGTAGKCTVGIDHA